MVSEFFGFSGFGFPSTLRETMLRQGLSGSINPTSSPSTSNTVHSHPGVAPSILGKRHRESSTTEQTDDRTEDLSGAHNLSEGDIRPIKKRMKVSEEGQLISEQNDSGHEEALVEDVQEGESTDSALRAPSFVVFSELEEPLVEFMDSPPPTNHLPDFFPSSPGPEVSPQQHPTTAGNTDTAASQQPFAFSFQATSSTPAHAMFMPSFPYPEPPQSPSPAGTNPTGLLNRHRPGRSDVFQAFGFPPPGRPAHGTGLHTVSGVSEGFINPAALAPFASDHDQTEQTADSGTLASSETAKNSEAGSSVGTETDTSQMKRTMYGTELEGDTRFGDFGVEGVGNAKGSFWTGGKY